MKESIYFLIVLLLGIGAFATLAKLLSWIGV